MVWLLLFNLNCALAAINRGFMTRTLSATWWLRLMTSSDGCVGTRHVRDLRLFH
jgi:hypothetical protein